MILRKINSWGFSTISCNNPQCISGYITYPGVSLGNIKTGYCDHPCLPSETCDQTKLVNRDSYDYDKLFHDTNYLQYYRLYAFFQTNY